MDKRYVVLYKDDSGNWEFESNCDEQNALDYVKMHKSAVILEEATITLIRTEVNHETN